MRHVVFVQSSPASLVERLAVGRSAAAPEVRLQVAQAGAGALIEVAAHGEHTTATIMERATTPDDLSAGRAAEARGRAAGMAALAARCPHVWVVESPAEAPAWLVLELCAHLAFVALGPILPPDGSTLLGVRSARERAERERAAIRR